MTHLRRNFGWNVAEVVISALILFFLYRMIVAKLGIAALGVWSLVAATTAVGRVFDAGASGGLTRYVALARLEAGDRHKAAVYVESAILMNTALYVGLGLLMYLPARWSLAAVTHGATTHDALVLLPLSLVAFALSSISAVVGSALVGFGRSDQKSGVWILALVGQLVTAVLLIPSLGLVGVAVSQVVQFAIQLVAGWVLTLRLLHGKYRIAIPRTLSRDAVKELLGFGLRLQSINMISLLNEPAIRYVFVAIGGVNMLGYYEMASRCVSQIRAVISAPAQNLVPLFAASESALAERAQRIYEAAVVGLGALALGGLGGFAAAAPIASYLLIGKISSTFIQFAWLCSLGWLVNIVAIPSYYLGIGLGHLRWNVAGAIVTTLVSPGMAWLLGASLGDAGLVAGAMIGVASGALLTMVMNARSFGVPIAPNLRHVPAILTSAMRKAFGLPN